MTVMIIFMNMNDELSFATQTAHAGTKSSICLLQ